MKRWYGKLLGVFAGAALFRPNPLLGALIGLLIGHAFDADWFRGPRENPYGVLDYVLEDLDMVLLMSVNPGFGGQSFIPSTLEKLARVRERIDASGRAIRLEVDGGVKPDNIARIAKAGADTFVAGSAIFGHADYEKVVGEMRAAVAAVR